MWRLGADIFKGVLGSYQIGGLPYWDLGDRLRTAHLK